MVMNESWTRRILLLIAVLLSGCSTSKETLLPTGDSTMLNVWRGAGESSGRHALAARDALRRPLTDTEQKTAVAGDSTYSRTQESEISQQFPRLPNPDMVMYVFPHLADGNTPVPGYSTVFPFYSQVQYAMPGERTEPY